MPSSVEAQKGTADVSEAVCVSSSNVESRQVGSSVSSLTSMPCGVVPSVDLVSPRGIAAAVKL